jgi:hypothetical protein
MAKKTKKTVRKTASKKATKTKGKKAKASAFKLYPVAKENPRRADTPGHKSFGIILKNPGISYEDFKKKGGRAQDLRWDIDHGHAKAK